MDPDEKLEVYDKAAQVTHREGVYELPVSYHTGDMWAPRILQSEALRTELAHLLDCIRRQERPINDDQSGLRVVQMLEAADQSLKERGKTVLL